MPTGKDNEGQVKFSDNWEKPVISSEADIISKSE